MTATRDEAVPTTYPLLRRAFAVVALAEALSWLGLLVGMWFKWIAGTTERGVEVFGPIHGGVFVAYVVLALVCWRAYRWSLGTVFWALAAAVPPFATLLFERWTERHRDRVWHRPTR